MSKAKVAIVGATGYGGAEIIRNLLFHPHVEITRLIAIDRVGEPIGEVHHSLYGKTDLCVENIPVEEVAPEVDAMFLHCLTKRPPRSRCACSVAGYRSWTCRGTSDFNLRRTTRPIMLRGIRAMRRVLHLFTDCLN